MATPTLTTINLEVIDRAEALGTAPDVWSGTSPAVDNGFFIEGSNSIVDILRTDLSTIEYSRGTAPFTAANKHFRLWMNFAQPAYLDTEANGGMELWANDGTNTQYITIFGSENYQGGWKNIVFDMNLFTTLTLANVRQWGVRFNRTAAPRNADNTWLDFMRYMDGYSATGGTSGDKIDLFGIATQDKSTTNAYGIVVDNEGVYFCYGQLQIGNGATTTFFEMDGDVLAFVDTDIAANFYTVSGNGSGANIVFNNAVIQAGGTTNNPRFIFDMSDTNITLSMTGTVLQRAAAISFATGQTISGNTFNDCFTITTNGATLTNCTINSSPSASATSVSNLNQLDGCVFTKGASGHAVELTGAAGNYTWDCTDPTASYDVGTPGNGVEVTGASITGDEHIHVTATTGTFNITVATGAVVPSVSSAGAIVNVTANQAALDITPSPALTNYEYRIYTVTARGSLAGATEVAGAEQTSLTTFSYPHTYSSGVVFAVQILPHDNDYEESITYYDDNANGIVQTIVLEKDINN